MCGFSRWRSEQKEKLIREWLCKNHVDIRIPTSNWCYCVFSTWEPKKGRLTNERFLLEISSRRWSGMLRIRLKIVNKNNSEFRQQQRYQINNTSYNKYIENNKIGLRHTAYACFVLNWNNCLRSRIWPCWLPLLYMLESHWIRSQMELLIWNCACKQSYFATKSY